MKLSKGKSETAYRIVSTTAEGKALARLDSLGLVEGEIVFVISASYAGLIVDIKGSRLAICKSMADKLEVEPISKPSKAPDFSRVLKNGFQDAESVGDSINRRRVCMPEASREDESPSAVWEQEARHE